MNEIKYIELKQETQLYDDVCQIIDGARGRIATYVNTEACLTNWYVGKRIKEDVLYNKRAEYGKQVIINLTIKHWDTCTLDEKIDKLSYNGKVLDEIRKEKESSSTPL